MPGATMGVAAIKDTARINNMLRKVKDLFPRDLLMAWTVKPEAAEPNILRLIGLKASARDGSAALSGDVVVDARQDYDRSHIQI